MTRRGPGGRSDRSLAARLAAGEQDALAELYDTHSPAVFGLALRVIGDRDAAEDVTQEVFVTFWAQPDRFDPDRGTLRAYLATIAHRRAVDHVRREEARRRRESRTVDAPTASEGTDDSALRTVAAEHIRAAVEALPTAQREALALAYFEGRTYREVAAHLAIPEGTAKSRLRAGLAALADILGETDPEPLP